MTIITSQCTPGEELIYESSSGTGSYLPFNGTLEDAPIAIFFNNQSSVAVTISDNATKNFMTFAPSQALSIDLQTNAPKSTERFSWLKGTQFYAKSAAGTGNFYISYLYAKRK